MQRHELFGRFADQFHRFYSLGYEYLNKDNVFTQIGLEFFDNLRAKTESILNEYKSVDQFFDLKWIDLDFRYSKFAEHNSIEKFNSFYQTFKN